MSVYVNNMWVGTVILNTALTITCSNHFHLHKKKPIISYRFSIDGGLIDLHYTNRLSFLRPAYFFCNLKKII